MSSTDPYVNSGEFIDVLSQSAWSALRKPIGAALRQAAPDQGPIVDIGAGTGLGTRLIAETVPTGQIIAVEPSPILRAVLLSRLVGDDALRQRVTVQHTDAEGMRLPARLGGVLAINMIGHVPPPQRRRLWTDLRNRMAPGTPLIVNLQPPAELTTVHESDFEAVRIGGKTYRGNGGARPAGEDTVTWTMRYEVIDEHNVVDRQVVVNYRWHVLSPQRLFAELDAAGFAASLHPMDIVVAVPAGAENL